MASFSYYQNQYISKRLGDDWATNGATITPDGFAEQPAFCSLIYATVRWGFDKLFR